jgi:molecular chaperone GrpE
VTEPLTNPETAERDPLGGDGAAQDAAAPAGAGRAGDVDSLTEPGAAVPPVEPVAGAPYESPDEMAARIKELTSDLQRLQAEYVNYKRRVDRDRDLVLQNAKFAILSALLPVLDDVDRAREHEELTGGFKAVAEALERVVQGEGLVKFGAQGDPFDPRHHEALMHGLSAEVSTTSCDKVVQAGYRVGDRLVRPALVTVLDPDPAAVGPGHPHQAPVPESRPDPDRDV